MKNISLILAILISVGLVVAQTEDKTSSKSNSDNTPQKLAQSGYSESVPYKPRQLKKKQKSKREKEKKSKKDSQKENQKSSSAPLNDGEISATNENLSITLPVLVFDADGNTVKNLEKSDFEVFVDDNKQELSNAGVNDQPLNVVLMLDVSVSVENSIEKIQNYALAVVERLRPQDKVMVITFDQRALVAADLTADRQVISKAIKNIKPGEGTSLWETVKYSLQKKINQINGRKIVVLVTDGVDTLSGTATFEDSLEEAEKSDVPFFPVYLDTYKQSNGKNNSPISDSALQQILSQNQIGVRIPSGQQISVEDEYERGRQYLNDIATLSGGRIIKFDDVSKLKKTGFESIFEAYRNQIYLSVNFAAVKGEQRKQIKVRVNRPNLFVQVRGSYIAKDKQ